MDEAGFLTLIVLVIGGLAQITYFAAMVLCLTIWKDRLPRPRCMEFALSFYGLGFSIFFIGVIANTFLLIFAEAYNTGYGSSREISQLSFFVVALLITFCGGASIFCFCLGLTQPRRQKAESHQIQKQPPPPERLPWQD